MANVQTEVKVHVANLDEVAALIREAKAERREGRRERIATAVLSGFAHQPMLDSDVAAMALHWADALIRRLDGDER